MAYVTETVDRELQLRNEYLAAENLILKTQIKGRLLLSDSERVTLAEIGYRLGCGYLLHDRDGYVTKAVFLAIGTRT